MGRKTKDRTAHPDLSLGQLRQIYRRKQMSFEEKEEEFFQVARKLMWKIYEILSEDKALTLGQIKRRLKPEDDDSYLVMAAIEALRSEQLIAISGSVHLTMYKRGRPVGHEDPVFSFARQFTEKDAKTNR